VDVNQIESWDASYSNTQSVHRTDDGIELYYEYRGEGPWLVILSGILVVSTAWRNFTHQLVKTNTVLTFDIRNQGGSSEGDGSYANHLRDLKSLLDGLEIEHAYLLGVSFATLFARDFAFEHPERVKGLIQCGPAISPYGSKRRDYLLKAWLTTLEASGPAGLFDASYPLVLGDRTIARGGSATYLALRERFLAVNSKAQLRANLEGGLEADDDPEKLRQLQCPVLLMTGDNDFSVGRSALNDQAALIPEARVEIIDHSGHAPYVEAPEAFESIVGEFITEVEGREISEADRP
jgi:pimeloyl-ACP methyl ester carboxylesterase